MSRASRPARSRSEAGASAGRSKRRRVRAVSGDRSDPGELDRQRPVLFLVLGGEVDFDPGQAAVVGEAWVPALEVAG